MDENGFETMLLEITEDLEEAYEEVKCIDFDTYTPTYKCFVAAYELQEKAKKIFGIVDKVMNKLEAE